MKQKLQNKFGRTLIEEQLKLLYRKNREALKQERNIREELLNFLDATTWTIVWIWILVSEKDTFISVRIKHLQKFETLLHQNTLLTNETNSVTQGKRTKVYNLSSLNLNNKEIQFLEKGLGFVPSFKNKMAPDIIANVEPTAKKLGEHGSLLIHHTMLYCKQPSNDNFDNLTKEERSILNSLKNNDDIIITNSDKGNSVVLLDKGTYNEKNLMLLKSDDYQKCDQDPTLKLEKSLKKTLKRLQADGWFQEKEVKHILNNNYKVPTLYGCPKIHKEDTPLRPIVSTLGTPWSALAKYLNNIVGPLAYPENNISVKNTQEFVSELRKLKLSKPTIILSLDVVNLFGSVPKNKCLALLRENLEADVSLNTRTLLPISTILELTTICVQTTYFKFGEAFYEQTEGLAMGSPLSPTLANIYLNNFDEQIKSSEEHEFLSFLKRYIDDYFAVWTNDTESLIAFHEKLNSYDNHIKLTLELETCAALPFLDILVMKNGQELTTSMYEKPIASGTLLNFNSEHPPHIKTNIIRNLSNKVRQCSDYPTEDLQKLSTKLKENGYPSKNIEENIKIRDQDKPTAPRKNGKLTITIPFQKTKSKVIKNKLRKLNVQVRFKRNRNIGEILGKKGKPDGRRNTNVVYKIPCECGLFYVGETGRDITTRIDEHKYAITKQTHNNGLARHVKDTNHKILFENYEILDRETNRHKREIKEAYYIRSLKAELNLTEGVNINQIWTE